MTEKKKKSLVFRLAILVFNLVVITIVVAILGYYFGGEYIKSHVLAKISEVTGVPVTVKDFSFEPLAGKVTIGETTIGNPTGFETSHSMRFSKLAVRLDIMTLLSEKIVVNQIDIDGLEVVFEAKLPTDNLSEIYSNIRACLERHGKKADTAGKDTTPKDHKGKTLAIEQFDIRNSKIRLSATGIGLGGNTVDLTLPDTHLKNIGTGPENGVPPDEIIMIVFRTIYDNSLAALKSSGVLKEKGKQVLEYLEDGAKNVTKGIRDFF